MTEQSGALNERRPHLAEVGNPTVPRPSRFVSVKHLNLRTNVQSIHLCRRFPVLDCSCCFSYASAVGGFAGAQDAGTDLPFHAHTLHCYRRGEGGRYHSFLQLILANYGPVCYCQTNYVIISDCSVVLPKSCETCSNRMMPCWLPFTNARLMPLQSPPQNRLPNLPK